MYFLRQFPRNAFRIATTVEVGVLEMDNALTVAVVEVLRQPDPKRERAVYLTQVIGGHVLDNRRELVSAKQ